jgi:proline racemase
MRFTQWISTVDTHTEGQATRIVTGGVPPLPGNSMRVKLEYFRNHHDGLRTVLLAEPRGHRDMYGCILTEPVSPEADFGVFFMHNSGYMNMCGHATIGLSTALFELGMIGTDGDSPTLVLDTPSGIVSVSPEIQENRVAGITFRNSPAFVSALDEVIDVPGVGELHVDVAYGGNYFVFFSAEEAGLELSRATIKPIVDLAMEVLSAANTQFRVGHPLYGEGQVNIATIVAPGENGPSSYRNVHVFGPRQFDRSPGGTGTSARLAVLHAKGLIGVGDEVLVESLTGGLFQGRITAETTMRDQTAVITEVHGSAHVTGSHQFWVDPHDRLGAGFLIEDT